jgi:hypothetical protein
MQHRVKLGESGEEKCQRPARPCVVRNVLYVVLYIPSVVLQKLQPYSPFLLFNTKCLLHDS